MKLIQWWKHKNNKILRLKSDRKKQQLKPGKRTYEILAKKLRNNNQSTTENDGHYQQTSNDSKAVNKNGGGSYLSRYTAAHQQQQNPSPRVPVRHQTNVSNPATQSIIKKKRAHFKEDSDSPDQQQLLAEQNMIINSSSSSFYNGYSPLSTPANYRNNNTSARIADPYGINPLPNIRSPYYSSRDTYFPNLESWGITNTSIYDDPYYLARQSPFLPYYNSLAKSRKVCYFFK